jgi:inorganic pyrophosphatase
MDRSNEPIWDLIGHLFKPHPWHGIPLGKEAPEMVTVFIEIVPTDTVKYEIDKATGYLKVDRPQRYSNIIPSMYGLLPKTYCGDRVAALTIEKTGREHIEGDHDPLDICVLSEKTIPHGNIILEAKPIGGFRMLDGNEADDKIIAVLKGDAMYYRYNDVSEVPHAVIERLRHYFLTYKEMPNEPTSRCEITHLYGHEEAHEVIKRSMEDYIEQFGNMDDVVREVLKRKGI